MNMINRIRAESLSKSYRGRKLFSGIDIDISSPASLCIKGPNGSGKSTLMKILTGLIQPSEGTIRYYNDTAAIAPGEAYDFIGICAPYIDPYGELTVYENIDFVLRSSVPVVEIDDYLREFGLYHHRNYPVSLLSTGLKQRLKYIISMINKPALLFLDEPGSNLDEPGKSIMYSSIVAISKKSMVVIATNSRQEERLCTEVITLGT